VLVVITDAENMMGDNLGQSPLSSVNDGDDKTLQGVKANENEVNGTSARDVSQWKLKRDIRLISKENHSLNHYFKSLMVSIKNDFKKLYYLRPTKLDGNPGTEKISIPG
jgi:hypothetical protein